MTTINVSPFGRYMWERLPFDVKFSSKIVQCKLDEALENLDGVFSIIDDVIIVGSGPIEAEAQLDKRKLTERCAEKNIIQKQDEQRLTKIIFHGHRTSKEGVKLGEA